MLVNLTNINGFGCIVAFRNALMLTNFVPEPCYDGNHRSDHFMRFRRSSPYGGFTGNYCYEVRGAFVYALKTPYSDASEKPEYEMRGNFLYRTREHPVGYTPFADYEIREEKVYRTNTHHWGPKTQPDYDVVV
jgi:hypothetical protein